MIDEENPPHRIGVECPTHGLHFNPEVSSGCVLCVRERRTRSGRLVLLAVAGLVLVAGVRYSLGPSEAAAQPDLPSVSPGRSESSSLPETIDSTRRLPAEPFQKVIAELESVLYQSRPPELEDVHRAAALGVRLGEQVRHKEPTAVRIVGELLAWSSAVDSALDVGYAAPDLSRARSQWERVREKCFEPASWFAHGSEAIVRAQTPAPPEINQTTIRGLKRVASDLHHLIAVGRPQALEIGEILGDVRTPETVEVESRWRRWRGQWSVRVQKVGEAFPPHPGMSANPNVIMAYQELDRALHQLRIVTVAVNETGVPFIHQRESNFRAAEAGLRQAEGYLAKIGF